MRGFGLPVWERGKKKAAAVRRKMARLRRNKRRGEEMPQGTVKGTRDPEKFPPGIDASESS